MCKGVHWHWEWESPEVGLASGPAGSRGLLGPLSFSTFWLCSPLCWFPSQAGSHHLAPAKSSGLESRSLTDPGEGSTPFLRKVPANVVSLIGPAWCPPDSEPATERGGQGSLQDSDWPILGHVPSAGTKPDVSPAQIIGIGGRETRKI